MAVDPKKAKEVFLSTIENFDPEQWSAFLDKTCGDNSELRQRVESLLAAHQGKDRLFDDPDVALITTGSFTEVTEGCGAVIGRYKLLKKIGEGGMAVVYMAEQTEPIRRKVALKIIKLGMDTKSVIARFEAERQALAMMDHPNIAKVLDAGATDKGRPYFVMELVKGVSITKYSDKNKLNTQERLVLFVQVCDAVRHAHQKGIIHRDIKPSNVLVTMHDDRAVPKVIDFGIAKATNQRLTEKTLFTRCAQMIGTPAYMSPEQAQMGGLDIDTRSDIYSLGILLYELLTGSAPFADGRLREAGYLEMQRIINEEEPVKPSTKLSTLSNTLTDIARQRCCTPQLLRKTIRGDLDWIVMKSLEKDRTRRYSSAGELVADIKRHLKNEPVLAGPPSVIYKTGKFIRRNRAFVAGLVMVIVAVSAGLVGMAMFAQKADRARDEALSALNFIEEGIFGRLDPSRDVGRKVGVEELLEGTAEDIDAGTYRDNPLVEARLCKTIGKGFCALGKFERAEHYLRRALDILQEQRGPQDIDTLLTQKELGSLYFFWLCLDEARTILAPALEGLRKVQGNLHPDTLDTMNLLGSVYMSWGNFAPAEALLREAIASARQLGPDYPDTPLYMCVLGLIQLSQQQLEEAETLFTEALFNWQYSAHSPLATGNPNRYQFLSDLARVYIAQQRYKEAEDLLTEVYQEAKVAPFLGEAHRETLYAMRYLSILYGRQGRYKEAERILQEALAAYRKHPVTQPCWYHPAYNLACFYARRGPYTKVQELFTFFLEDSCHIWGPDHPATIRPLNNIAWNLATHPAPEVRDGAKAVGYATRACELSQWQSGELIDTLAAAYAEIGDFNEAVMWQEQAIELFRQTYPESDMHKVYENRLKLYQSGKPFHMKSPKDDELLNVGE